MEENFSVEGKIFRMEWNGRKLPVWNMEKSPSIPCPDERIKSTYALMQLHGL